MQKFFKVLLVLGLSCFLFSKPSFGARAISSDPGKTLFAPGLAVPLFVDPGETGAGLSLGLLWPTDLSSRLYVGADLGLHFWGKAFSTTQSSTGLQLLPTVIYQFNPRSNWVPFLGLSAGGYWWVAQPTGSPGFDFMLVFRPGVLIPISSSMGLSVEAKYGSLGGAFIFIPTISVNLSL